TVTPFQLRSGPSTHVHDPLHVRAIAFQNGDDHLILTLIDAIGIGLEMSQEAKQKVADATGWDPERMLISATHAHTTPKGGDSSPGRIAYEKLRRDGLVKAMLAAVDSLQPAKVGFASDEDPSEVRNRRWHYQPDAEALRNPLNEFDTVRTNGPNKDRIKPAGPIDPEIAVIDIRTNRNKPLGLIANYALHYVGGLPKVIDADGRVRGVASADYFGEFSRIMPYRLGGQNPPENFVAMMTNGASGDINNLPFDIERPPRAPFEQIRVVANKTADAAWRASRKIDHYQDSPLLRSRQRMIPLTFREPTDEEVTKALRLLELTMPEQRAIHDRTNSVARNTVAYAEPDFDRTEDVLIQAHRIGDQAIVSLPFEVLVEIGLELKAKSPFPHTMVVALANGGYGYLPPPNQIKLGGYETWIGTSKFTSGSSEILTENLLEMLAELKAAQ
ncbi:MAG: hypothetical protein AAF226_05935, partial [Verrucomicrobiota bacterium]